MNPKVTVLLSTYNGEKYLQEQLDSLLDQRGVDLEIDVRDDGSSDRTLAILAEYAEKHSNIHVRSAANIGAARSFMELLYQCEEEADYYAFSDQDDIWDPDKLIRAVELICGTKTGNPVLYYSALNTFNMETGERALWKNEHEYSFEESLFQSHYPGCTMVINRSGFELIRRQQQPSIVVMHDLFVVQVFMATKNRIIYDSESHINYRLHGSNVSVKPASGLANLKRLIRISRGQKGLRSGAAGALKEAIRKEADAGYIDILSTAAEYQRSIQKKNRLLKTIRKTSFDRKTRLMLQLAVLMNIY